jgi:hypothetical protein
VLSWLRAFNVILVHGAWADGSSWAKVISILLRNKLEVKAIQLPLTSLEAEVSVELEKGLNAHAASS